MRAIFRKPVLSRKFIPITILILILAILYGLYGLKTGKIRIQPFNKMKIGSRSEKTPLFYQQGLTALKQKDYNQAITNFNKALAVDPKNTELYIKKSEAEYALGQKEAALKTVEEGLKVSPDNEVLKGRRDILLKNWLAEPDQDTPKQ